MALLISAWLINATVFTTARAVEKTAPRPNVLLLVSDDQRPDTIGALGNKHIDTPNLDRLAKLGSVFTRATCANPICTPSRAEIFSGCSGFRNGVIDFGGKIDPQLDLWAETMSKAGYHTWYVGKWHNDGRPIQRGYEESQGLYSGGGSKWYLKQKDWQGRPITGYRGWIFQDDQGKKYPEKGVGLTADISRHFADAAISLIRRKTTKPFFLHVNFTAPHDPLIMPPGYMGKYDPEKIPLPQNFAPEHPFDHGNFDGRDERLLPWPRTPKAVREEIAYYYSVISHMDEQIGRIFAALKETNQWENTIIIFTSDHGLAIGSHGLRGKQNMYEHTIGVPMIFRGPGVPQGKLFDAQMYLRDMYPSVCDLTGVAIPKTVEGKSVVPVLQGKTDSIYPHIFGYFRDSQRMIRTDRWKLIHYPQINRTQLFDLVADPLELKDLSSDTTKAKIKSELHSKLLAWQKSVGDSVLTVKKK